MKANRKFKRDDEAVSPVIAVILMVAITVVLAATVYVWVSGFGSNSNSSPAHTMSLVSAGAVSGDANTDLYAKEYTVSSASPSLTYEDITLTVGGDQYTFVSACTQAPTAAAPTATPGFAWGACAGSTARAAGDSVRAGDIIQIACFDTAANCLSEQDLLFLDTESNSIMVSLKVR